MRSLIEIGVLQAEAQWVLNLRAGAQASRCRALALAEPERFQRIFLDAGDRLLPLIDVLAPHDDCAARLQAALRAGDAAAQASLRENGASVFSLAAPWARTLPGG